MSMREVAISVICFALIFIVLLFLLFYIVFLVPKPQAVLAKPSRASPWAFSCSRALREVAGALFLVCEPFAKLPERFFSFSNPSRASQRTFWPLRTLREVARAVRHACEVFASITGGGRESFLWFDMFISVFFFRNNTPSVNRLLNIKARAPSYNNTPSQGYDPSTRTLLKTTNAHA